MFNIFRIVVDNSTNFDNNTPVFVTERNPVEKGAGSWRLGDLFFHIVGGNVMSDVATAKKWLRINGAVISIEMANSALELLSAVRRNGNLLWVLRDMLDAPALTCDVSNAIQRQHKGIDYALVSVLFHIVRARVTNKERLLFDMTPY